MGKQVVWIVVLLVVIVGAVIYGVSKTRGGRQPEWMRTEVLELIDTNTGEAIAKPRKEWDALGHRQGIYKNPKTHQYTMVMPMTCKACGAKTPDPLMSAMGSGVGLAAQPGATASKPAPNDDSAPPTDAGPVGVSGQGGLRAAAKCIKCGKNPYGAPATN